MDRAREHVAVPSNVQTSVEVESDARVLVAPDEAELAMYCLVENAADALAGTSGTIRLSVAVRDSQVAVEVADDATGGLPERALEAFFTARARRMGIGLNIAKRIAARWNGTLALAALDRRARAAFTFRVER